MTRREEIFRQEKKISISFIRKKYFDKNIATSYKKYKVACSRC